MRLWWAMRSIIAVLFLASAIAGCADVAPADRVLDAFDDVDRLPGNVTSEAGLPSGFAVIKSNAIEASRDGSTWSSSLVVEPEALRHMGDQPPAQPDGGGSRIDLATPDLGMLHARLATNTSLDGITVAWFAARGTSLESGVLLGNTSADGVLEVPFPTGTNRLFAMLMDGDKPVATTGVPLPFGAILTWEVHDSVHPVNPNGAAPMDDDQRAARADRYHLPAGMGGTLAVETAFDGTWTPNQGTDVDLEFLDGATSLQCIGTGGGSTLPVDPAQASETGEQTLTPDGEGIVRIGYVSSACGAFYYHNAGPVPYRATLRLDTT